MNNKTAILVLIAILLFPLLQRASVPVFQRVGGPISLYGDVADLVAYAKKAKEAFRVMAETLSTDSTTGTNESNGTVAPVVPVVPVVPEWSRGSTLYFCEPGSALEAEANRQHRLGKRVFRIFPRRADLYKAFGATVDTIITVEADGTLDRRVSGTAQSTESTESTESSGTTGLLTPFTPLAPLNQCLQGTCQ